MLANFSAYFVKFRILTLYRLYNEIAFMRDDFIVFINHVLIDNYFFVTKTQIIWATIYLDKQFALLSITTREQKIALFTL